MLLAELFPSQILKKFLLLWIIIGVRGLERSPRRGVAVSRSPQTKRYMTPSFHKKKVSNRLWTGFKCHRNPFYFLLYRVSSWRVNFSVAKIKEGLSTSVIFCSVDFHWCIVHCTFIRTVRKSYATKFFISTRFHLQCCVKWRLWIVKNQKENWTSRTFQLVPYMNKT